MRGWPSSAEAVAARARAEPRINDFHCMLLVAGRMQLGAMRILERSFAVWYG